MILGDRGQEGARLPAWQVRLSGSDYGPIPAGGTSAAARHSSLTLPLNLSSMLSWALGVLSQDGGGLRGEPDAVLGDNGLCLGAGGVVGVGGTRCDLYQRVADDVGHHREDLGRGTVEGKRPPTCQWEMLGDGLHFCDIRPWDRSCA